MLKCKICDKEYKNYNGLAQHILKTHKISSQKYYDEYFKKENEEICKNISCNNKTRFVNINLGYKKYCYNCGVYEKPLEYRKKISNTLKGKKLSEKRKKNISKATKGKINLAENNGMYKYPAFYINCLNCGKRIRVRGCLKNKKFCNNACKSEWQRKNTPSKEKSNFVIYKDRIRETNLRKYGVTNPMKLKCFQEKVRNTQIKNGTIGNFLYQSKIANQFINELLKILPKQFTYYYGDKETFVRNKRKMYFYDFEVRELKKIIEFNGDRFHANPKLFQENDHPHPHNKKITAKEMWNNDNKKLNFAKRKGYKVFTVWENDYKNNPNLVLKESKNFLLSKEQLLLF